MVDKFVFPLKNSETNKIVEKDFFFLSVQPVSHSAYMSEYHCAHKAKDKQW